MDATALCITMKMNAMAFTSADVLVFYIYGNPHTVVLYLRWINYNFSLLIFYNVIKLSEIYYYCLISSCPKSGMESAIFIINQQEIPIYLLMMSSLEIHLLYLKNISKNLIFEQKSENIDRRTFFSTFHIILNLWASKLQKFNLWLS